MKFSKHFSFRFIVAAGCFLTAASSALLAEGDEAFRVLVFSKTAGFRHGSIETGVEAVKEIGAENGFSVEASEDASIFNAGDLARFQAIVFLNTTGTIFDGDQREAMQAFIRGGGGYVGVHSAADTEYDWEWYGKLVGGYFKTHPRIQEAIIEVENQTHPATRHLPGQWRRADEWYSYRANPRDKGLHVLMALDTDSFEGSVMGDDHPIAWFHEFEGGRAFYTGLGHTKASYGEEAYRAHLLGAIRWAAGVTGGEPLEQKPAGR